MTKSYDKRSQYHQRMKVKRQHKDATKNFVYTTIADRLRTVSWSYFCHPTGVVKPGLRDPNLPTNRKSCSIKRTHEVV